VFSANYDYTIIDAPALNAAADAAILGKMTDGVLLVVRPGVVDTTAANHAKEFIDKSGQHVLGQVINGFDSNTEQYYSYYYLSKNAVAEDTMTPEEERFSPIASRKS
jgi:polysaccharide biosynthesis transport protein